MMHLYDIIEIKIMGKKYKIDPIKIAKIILLIASIILIYICLNAAIK
jgi:hypothetical protein